MKTSTEWMDNLKDHPDSKRPTLDLMSWAFLETLIEDIQRDALNSPFVNTNDQQELEMMRDTNQRLAESVGIWEDKYKEMRAKWHEARRYLRAANKGAERNNQVMRLQAHEISKLIGKNQGS